MAIPQRILVTQILFITVEQLIVHIVCNRLADPRLACAHCDLQASDRESLALHLLEQHAPPADSTAASGAAGSTCSAPPSSLVSQSQSQSKRVPARLSAGAKEAHVDVGVLKRYMQSESWLQELEREMRAETRAIRAQLAVVPSLTRRRNKHVFLCELCPFVTNARLDLNTHLALHVREHSARATLACPRCAYWCRLELMLQKHLRVHAPDYRSRKLSNYGVTDELLAIAVANRDRILRERIGEEPPTTTTTTGAANSSQAAAPPMSATAEATDAQVAHLDATFPPAASVKRQPEAPSVAPLPVAVSVVPNDDLSPPPADGHAAPLSLACSKCPFATCSAERLELHAQMHTSPRGPRLCPHCNYSAVTENALDAHLLLHALPNANLVYAQSMLVCPRYLHMQYFDRFYALIDKYSK